MTPDEAFSEIDRLRTAYPDVVLPAEGADERWVEKAEDALGVRLPPSLKRFLREYGGATIGGEIVNGLLGVPFEDAVGPDIVYNTLLDREQSNLAPHLIDLADNDGDELFLLNTAVADTNGENPVVRVLIEAPDEQEAYATSFAGFLLKRIQFALAGHVPPSV